MVIGEDGGMREETKLAKERPEGRKERKNRRKIPHTQITAGRIVLHIFLLLLLILTFALGWADDNFGMVSFDEIVFHINMPLEGTATNLLQDFMRLAVLRGFLVWLVLMALVHFPSGKAIEIRMKLEDGGEKRFWIFPVRLPLVFLSAVSAVWFCWLFFTVDAKFSVVDYVKSQLQNSTLIEKEYVFPEQVSIVFPEKKRNLICIYIESAESSTQDIASGGLFKTNYIPELTQIEAENVSFSQNDLYAGASMAPGTTWTVGGLVAETAGIPLILPNNYNNVMGSYEFFLPGAVSLGDILEEEGYHNYFFAGSGFTFGGRTEYFTQHGHYEIRDYPWAKRTGRIPADYNVWWGMEDAKVFEVVKEDLPEIAASGEPFNVSLLTADTHTPSGYVCELCRDDYDSQYANVWACTSRQVHDFVEWCKEQDFYENTTIFICGDHVSMEPYFYGSNTKDDYPGQCKRKVYNAFVNPAVLPAQEKNRVFTTMDMYPTILGSMGVTIENERLGLGTNLFSGEETLSEKYGNEYLFEELLKKSNFYNTALLYPES